MAKQFVPFIDRVHPAGAAGGVQRVYKFANGFGASVVKTPHTYGGDRGLWELGVVEFFDGDRFRLNYSTPITDDVIGYLTDDDVSATLEQIEALEPA